MKNKSKVKVFVISICLFSFFNQVYADVIEKGFHRVRSCVTINNLENFPGVVLITFSGAKYNARLIRAGECVNSDYQSAIPDIYAAEKNYIDSNGLPNLNVTDRGNNAPWMNEEIFFPAKKMFEGSMPPYVVPDSNPLIEQNIELAIAGFSGNHVVLYESKSELIYRNGQHKTLEYRKPSIANLRSIFRK